MVALRKESVDRNPGFAKYAYGRIKSLSARRAWIEIGITMVGPGMMILSLSARRAWIEMLYRPRRLASSVVALRKESVDRNSKARRAQSLPCVALRKESVDRNSVGYATRRRHRQSLSARRAWIEIRPIPEGIGLETSLSARRAWIEMAWRGKCRPL